MQNYHTFPPCAYLVRVVKNCPKSAFLYIQLWQKKNEYSQVDIEKKSIRKSFLMSATIFRNLLAPLVLLNLLEVDETEDGFHIDIIGLIQNDH